MAELTEIKKATQLAWRRFLLSNEGIEGQLILREACPSVAPGDAHTIIFSSGKAEGWRMAIAAMHTLIAVEKVKSENLENP